PPESVQARYADLNKVYGVEEEAQLVAKAANRIAIDFLGEYTRDQISGEVLVQAVLEGTRMIDLTLSDSPNTASIAKETFMRQLAFTPDGLLTTHAEKLFS